MTIWNSAKNILGPAIMAAALIAPNTADAGNGSSFSRKSTPTRTSSSFSSINHTAMAVIFLMAASSSRDAEDPAKLKAHQDNLDKIIVDPSNENIAKLSTTYQPYAQDCQRAVNSAGLITTPEDLAKVRPVFQGCLKGKAADAYAISTYTLKDKNDFKAIGFNSYVLDEYLPYLPACQKQNGITPGVSAGVTGTQARAAWDCATASGEAARQKERTETSNLILGGFFVGILGLAGAVGYEQRSPKRG